MAWTGGTGSGDMIMGSGDTLATGTVSAQVGVFGDLRISSVASLAAARVGSLQVTGVSSLGRAMVSSNLGLGAFPNSAQLVFAMANVVTAPGSGEFTVGGVLYVESGALRFMGANGVITLVATSG